VVGASIEKERRRKFFRRPTSEQKGKSMSVKSIVSSSYLEAQKAGHAHKPFRDPPNVFITGAMRENSIGFEIAAMLSEDIGSIITYNNEDVRGDWLDLGKFEDIDTLIMCHGVTYLDWFENIPYQKAKEIFDVNLYGTFNVAQAFVNETLDTDYRKRIICIGSMAYKHVLNGSAAYCASKAGAAHLMKCLAWELAPKGYDVYSIHPSNTLDTPMSGETIAGLMRYRALTEEEATAYWNDSMIRNQSLTTTEIARTVRAIINDGLGYLSGCNLELTGGQR
jgi:NAD(P)-dependent dehydrogenase (short-subunit alcohol dehydrogenase family)